MSAAAAENVESPHPQFQRSYSRVFYESEYSTTRTSWEFCGLAPLASAEETELSLRLSTPRNKSLARSLHQSPMPASNSPCSVAHLSLLRSSLRNSTAEHSPAAAGASISNELHSDASRNSTGSSAGSHKSQDSGFSDSGETRRVRNEQLVAQLQASVHAHTLNDHHHSRSRSTSSCSQSHPHRENRSLNINQPNDNGLFTSATFKDSQFVHQHHRSFNHDTSNENHRYHDMHLSLPVPPLPTTQAPIISVVVNGTTVTPKHTAYCANGNCSCHEPEVIVSRQGQRSSLVGNDPIDGAIGAPTFCSTPKKAASSPPPFTPSKMTVMQKIDNFESLNKNVNVAANSKVLDPNNNNSNNSYAVSSFGSGNETRSSFFSRPPSRIPTPPPIMPKAGANSVSHSRGHSSVDKTASYATIVSNHRQSEPKSDDLDESLFSFCKISPKPSPQIPSNDLSTYSASSQFHLKPASGNGCTWQTLPKGFKRIYVRDEPSRELIVKSHFDNDAVRLWLHELRAHTEPECFHALQLKDLNYSSYYCNESTNSVNFNSSFENKQENCNGNVNLPSSAPVHLVSGSILSIRSVERTASIISGEFSRICKYLEFKLHAKVPPIIFALLDNIEDFLAHLKDSYGYHTKVENRLACACSELRMSTLTFSEDIKKESRARKSDFSQSHCERPARESPYLSAMVDGVVSIGNQFSKVVDQRLTKDLSTILDVIESGGFGARMALESFSIVLYDGGMHICRLAAHLRTVRGLLSCIIDTKDENEQILALRCLSTILCVGEAVKDFDNAGGFEIVADILHDSGFGQSVKCEAVAVLTQVTDPWIDLEATLCNLGAHLEKIVVSLTNLVHLYSNEPDSFLLLVAAISNLTFLEPSSIDLLKAHGTVQFIINAVQQKADYYSVFIMDHVSTILANMAGVERCRSEVIRAGGVTILLYFLRKSPSPFDSIPEITACERLQQKSTIAISRLANEVGVPELVLKLGGIQRLVQLSKEEKERNYSDGVLIACLATLRKLVTVCGDELIEQLAAQDLIYPRLLDSFLLFSSRQESCV